MGRKRHSSSNGSCDPMAIIMATILAQGLKPEHKLPNKEMLQPKAAFMSLLATVGAKGKVFTSQQILQYLIKYIEGSELYDPLDPRKVYCEKDQLGQVFGVNMFTIQDAKNLILANVDKVASQVEKSKAVLHQRQLQHDKRHYYYTLQHILQRTPGSTSSQSIVPGPLGVDECDTPKKSQRKSHALGVRPQSESAESRSSKKHSSYSFSISDKDEMEHLVPWYAKKYPNDDLTSLSTDQFSIQNQSTAEITNSSDDLWFLEDEQVEFEIESETSSESYGSVSDSSSEDNDDTELILEVDIEDDESILGDVDSDTDSVDTEISERDKWECIECNAINPPIHGYCMVCWALRKGWLADEKRLTLKERLMTHQRTFNRSLSAPSDLRQQGSNVLASVDVCDGFPKSSDGEEKQDVGNDDYHQFRIIPDVDPVSDLNQVVERTESLQPNAHDEAGIGTAVTMSNRVTSSTNPIVNDCATGIESDDEEPACKQAKLASSSVSSSLAGNSAFDQPFCPPSWKRSQSWSVSQAAGPSVVGPGFSSVGQESSWSMICRGQGSIDECSIDVEQAGTSRLNHDTEHPKITPSGKPLVFSDMCMICETRTKNASIIHGRSGHQVSCYSCAKKLRRHGKPCPVCRQKIQHVIKNYLV